MLVEANIDALVGPTHHYAGLGVGNVASIEHKLQPSHPRAAALEGLDKAEWIAGQGIPQFLWLPPERPRLDFLARLGFEGKLAEQLQRAAVEAPQALSAAFSSAFMWAANSATVTPAMDALDGHYHFTPANMLTSWHRGLEAEERSRDLHDWAGKDPRCRIHQPLPALFPLRDEGAANHMRLCDAAGLAAVHVFVYGSDDQEEANSEGFLPRHSLAASRAICRRHALPEEACCFLRQHPKAIAAGVFHNDVIATSHQHLLLHHQLAFVDAEDELNRLESVFEERTGTRLLRIEVSDNELPLADAVASYFFNSQILSPSSSSAQDLPRMLLVCPQQCEQIPAARQLVERLVADRQNPIESVHYVSVAESMAGGGGPACLRLRVPADQRLLESVSSGLRVDSELLDRMRRVIEREYPDCVTFADLADLELTMQARRATHALREVVKTRTASSGPGR